MLKSILEIANAYDVAVVLIVLVLAILAGIREYKKYMNMSKEDRLKAILSIVKKEVLELMCSAEEIYSEYDKSGKLKESNVISEIYEKFPVLSEFKNQDEIIDIITGFIKDEMETMNKIVNKL